jgi:hypothetical protein
MSFQGQVVNEQHVVASLSKSGPTWIECPYGQKMRKEGRKIVGT